MEGYVLPRDLLSPGAARQRRQGRDRRCHPRPPGRDRRGATGSGKTTQLPKIALELGRERIAHTQPRRLAARTIAERVAEELHVELGTLVGYKVRFTDKVSDATRIALMTDGILLNEIHRDRLLTRYDTIIIDEAHERSLNVDFLLGYLARILPERPDLKMIITSATIDPESFAKHFAAADGTPAPIIEVSGRTYPVEIRYRGPVEDADDESAPAEPEDEVSAIVAALRELDREAPGDVLVFLPGEAEIRDAADAVRGAYANDRSPTEVLPLFGRLSAADQHRVFERSRVAGVRRRVILATNVAETSLTVPGIKYVIDTGTARISRYSNRSKVQRLPIEAISQASANQRSGRAGRTSDGIAIRLYSEEDFDRRPEFTEPEILRTSLASVILQMLSLGFGDISAFPFLTPPDSRGVKAAFDLLTELGAVEPSRRDGSPHLTRTGRDISRMPIDPRFARMLIEAGRSGSAGTVTRDVLAIVSGMTIQDVRERPEERREEADRLHARFVDPTSDFLTLLNLWNHLREQQRELGSSAFRRLCRAEHLNYVRVREWFDVHRQLRTLVKTPDRSHDDTGTSDPDAIHRSLLAGLLSQIGILDERTAPAGKAHSPPRSRRAGASRSTGVPAASGSRSSPDPVCARRVLAP
ncbi:ATP-dependent RNA helicase HrpA [Microbacterium sp. Se5.02b]|uniref:ATP-dependent RNA helicase HrpA n=1 Tax=Microbacterium sp. Se5.02b TaxID=2864103 RepID=UPI0037C92B2B